MLRPFLLILAAVGALLASPAAAQSFPELTGRVVDQANILPAETEAQLTAELAALETQSNRQLVVATVTSLEGYDISDYGYRLGREWGIGQEGEDNGAILLVAPNERRVRIEVGYGLEASVKDEEAAQIIQDDILPHFRKGDFETGVAQGVDSLIFYPVAFYGIWTTDAVITVMITNWLLKVFWEAALTPVTYAVVGWLKKAEGVDLFDTETDFSPFSGKEKRA